MIAFVSTLILLALGGVSPVSHSKGEDLWAKGRQLFVEKKYPEALVVFQDLRAKGDDSAGIHYNLGRIYSELKRPVDADAHLLKSIARVGKDLKARDRAYETWATQAFSDALAERDNSEAYPKYKRLYHYLTDWLAYPNLSAETRSALEKRKNQTERIIVSLSKTLFEDDAVKTHEERYLRALCNRCPCVDQKLKSRDEWAERTVAASLELANNLDLLSGGLVQLTGAQTAVCCQGESDLHLSFSVSDQVLSTGNALNELFDLRSSTPLQEIEEFLPQVDFALLTLEKLARNGAFPIPSKDIMRAADQFIKLIKLRGDLLGRVKIVAEKSGDSLKASDALATAYWKNYEPLSRWLKSAFVTGPYPNGNGRWSTENPWSDQFPAITIAIENQVRFDCLGCRSSVSSGFEDFNQKLGRFEYSVLERQFSTPDAKVLGAIRVVQDDYRRESVARGPTAERSDQLIQLGLNPVTQRFADQLVIDAYQAVLDIEPILKNKCATEINQAAKPALAVWDALERQTIDLEHRQGEVAEHERAEAEKYDSKNSSLAAEATSESGGTSLLTESETLIRSAQKKAAAAPPKTPPTREELIQAIRFAAGKTKFKNKIPIYDRITRLILDLTLDRLSKLSLGELSELKTSLETDSLNYESIKGSFKNKFGMQPVLDHPGVTHNSFHEMLMMDEQKSRHEKDAAQHLKDKVLDSKLTELSSDEIKETWSLMAQTFEGKGWEKETLGKQKDTVSYLETIINPAKKDQYKIDQEKEKLEEALNELNAELEFDEATGEDLPQDLSEISRMLSAGDESDKEGRLIGVYVPEEKRFYVGKAIGFKIGRYSSSRADASTPQDPPRTMPMDTDDLVLIRQSPSSDGILKVPSEGMPAEVKVNGKNVTADVVFDPIGGFFTLEAAKSNQVEILAYQNARAAPQAIEATRKAIEKYYGTNAEKVPLKYPESLKKLIAELKLNARNATNPEEINFEIASQIKAWIQSNITYGNDEKTRKIFTAGLERAKRDPNYSIQQLVLDAKLGDCDTENSLFVTILIQEFGIPARLKLGYVAEEGKINTKTAHGWSQVWLPLFGGWVDIDATSPSGDNSSGAAGVSQFDSKLVNPKPKDDKIFAMCLVSYFESLARTAESDEFLHRAIGDSRSFVVKVLQSVCPQYLSQKYIDSILDTYFEWESSARKILEIVDRVVSSDAERNGEGALDKKSEKEIKEMTDKSVSLMHSIYTMEKNKAGRVARENPELERQLYKEKAELSMMNEKLNYLDSKRRRNRVSHEPTKLFAKSLVDLIGRLGPNRMRLGVQGIFETATQYVIRHLGAPTEITGQFLGQVEAFTEAEKLSLLKIALGNSHEGSISEADYEGHVARISRARTRVYQKYNRTNQYIKPEKIKEESRYYYIGYHSATLNYNFVSELLERSCTEYRLKVIGKDAFKGSIQEIIRSLGWSQYSRQKTLVETNARFDPDDPKLRKLRETWSKHCHHFIKDNFKDLYPAVAYLYPGLSSQENFELYTELFSNHQEDVQKAWSLSDEGVFVLDDKTVKMFLPSIQRMTDEMLIHFLTKKSDVKNGVPNQLPRLRVLKLMAIELLTRETPSKADRGVAIQYLGAVLDKTPAFKSTTNAYNVYRSTVFWKSHQPERATAAQNIERSLAEINLVEEFMWDFTTAHRSLYDPYNRVRVYQDTYNRVSPPQKNAELQTIYDYNYFKRQIGSEKWFAQADAQGVQEDSLYLAHLDSLPDEEFSREWNQNFQVMYLLTDYTRVTNALLALLKSNPDSKKIKKIPHHVNHLLNLASTSDKHWIFNSLIHAAEILEYLPKTEPTVRELTEKWKKKWDEEAKNFNQIPKAIRVILFMEAVEVIRKPPHQPISRMLAQQLLRLAARDEELWNDPVVVTLIQTLKAVASQEESIKTAMDIAVSAAQLSSRMIDRKQNPKLQAVRDLDQKNQIIPWNMMKESLDEIISIANTPGGDVLLKNGLEQLGALLNEYSKLIEKSDFIGDAELKEIQEKLEPLITKLPVNVKFDVVLVGAQKLMETGNKKTLNQFSEWLVRTALFSLPEAFREKAMAIVLSSDSDKKTADYQVFCARIGLHPSVFPFFDHSLDAKQNKVRQEVLEIAAQFVVEPKNDWKPFVEVHRGGESLKGMEKLNWLDQRKNLLPQESAMGFVNPPFAATVFLTQGRTKSPAFNDRLEILALLSAHDLISPELALAQLKEVTPSKSMDSKTRTLVEQSFQVAFAMESMRDLSGRMLKRKDTGKIEKYRSPTALESRPLSQKIDYFQSDRPPMDRGLLERLNQGLGIYGIQLKPYGSNYFDQSVPTQDW